MAETEYRNVRYRKLQYMNRKCTVYSPKHLQDICKTFGHLMLMHCPQKPLDLVKSVGFGSLETQLPEVASSRSALQAALPADFFHCSDGMVYPSIGTHTVVFDIPSRTVYNKIQ